MAANADPSFGVIVKEHRRVRDLTQAELARRVGCAAITIRKIEADALRPSQQIAERLAMALGIPLEERAAFVRLARVAALADASPSPLPTPPVLPEEIGQEDLSGRAIRGYALGERLGAGGYGVVYRAVQPLVEREVAVKIILPQYADQPDFIRRFEAEAQLVARLEHPHIVPLYDYWREPGVAYLVMRLLRGGSLAATLQAGPLPLLAVALLLEQIGAALHTAHRAGIIHRDLKPANVMLDEDNNAYLADFGIAKNLGNPNLADLTQPGLVIGSPAYFSPEQILAEPVKPQTDIYCLGIMLYELLTGRKPYDGPSPIFLIQQHLNEPIPSLAAHCPDLPSSLDPIIQRATAKDQGERYPDVLSLMEDFRQALLGRGVGAHPRELPGAGGSRGEFLSSPLHPLPPAHLLELTNPYKGLRAFTEADAADFFGRETLIQELLARMGEVGDPASPSPWQELARFLAVVGPSGSGKSSVVRAGLVPSLRQGGLPGSDKWFIVEMLPGSHPWEELEAALLRIAVNPPESLLAQLREDERGLLRAVRRVLPADESVELVLIIDQFEELFTLVADEETRLHFLNSLVTAVLDPRSRLRLVITLRADFTDRPLRYVDFGELLRQRAEFVLPLTPDELEQAIAGPAQRIGLSLEPGLVAAISRDVGDEPGALPLLQYALTELFERSVGNDGVGANGHPGPLLTKQAYQSIGGVLGALARRADDLYNSLDSAGQEAARQLFLRLVTLGEGAEDTRRRVLQAEIEALAAKQTPSLPLLGKGESSSPSPSKGPVLSNGEGEDRRGGLPSAVIGQVIELFGRHRLLTFDRHPMTRGPTVEVAHEALIREWDRLRQWLNESREDIRQERTVARAAKEWDRSQRDVSFLLRGTRLEQIERWQETTTLLQTPLEQEFIAQSLQQRAQEHQAETARKAREARLERRSRNFLRGLVAVFAAAAIISAGLGLYALWQRQAALDNAAEAQNVALVAGSQAALANNDTDAALALAWQAVSLNPDSALAQAQLSEVAYTPGTVRRYVGHTDSVTSVALSPDETTMLSTSWDNALFLWDVKTGEILRQFEGHTNAINDVDFSADGRMAISGSEDKTAILWDVQTGQNIRKFDSYSAAIVAVEFSPDGKSIVAAGWNDDLPVIRWDIETGQVIQRYEGNATGMQGLAFTPDGSAILSASNDGLLLLWDAYTGQIIHQMDVGLDEASGSLREIVISPDGRTAISGIENSEMLLWSLSTGKLIRRYPVDGGVLTVAFHPNDGSVFVGTGTSTFIQLDLQTGEILNTFTGHNEVIIDVEIFANGRYAISASADKTLRLWELERGQVMRRFAAPNALLFEVDLSPDGRTALSGSTDGTVTLWDVATGKMIRQYTDDQPVMAVTYSPDGQTALIGTGYRFAQKIEPGHVILWDVETGEEVRRFEGQPYVVYDVEFSPDGKRAVSSGNGAVVILWNVETGQEIRRFEDYFVDSPWPLESFWDIEFSPDGRTVLGAYGKGPIVRWDVETGAELDPLLGHVDSGATGITFSPNGQRFVSSGWDTQAILWDTKTGGIIRRFTNHVGPIGQIDFTPDERLMLGGSGDGTNSLWDVETGEQIRRYGNGFVMKPVFNSDGGQALVGFYDGTVELWRMDTTLDELLEWTQTNRYIPELTCNQRELYRVEPLCESVE
jgi:WD40 repeat protein/DNA-binding XRE family transcriptional regulator